MIMLPTADGGTVRHRVNEDPSPDAGSPAPFASRSVLAPAPVLADPRAANEPFGPPLGPPPVQTPDWDASMRVRHHLWAHGYTVAEAFDTAHRGFGLDAGTAMELVRRTGKEAASVGGRFVAPAWTDQLAPGVAHPLDAVVAAYAEQLEVIESAGGQPAIMASGALAAAARGPQEYAEVYDLLIGQLRGRVLLHWLLPAWAPDHQGYWGHPDRGEAVDAFLDVVHRHRDRIDGVKVAPLEPPDEIALRRRLPDGARFYTGDVDTVVDLVAGDEHGFSDVLTPVVTAVPGPAAAALRRLDDGDVDGFRAGFARTAELVAHVFAGPGRSTLFFKTGLVFLGWLAGVTPHVTMFWGEQTARSVPHLATTYRLADELGLFPDPELAAARMTHVLALAGLDR